MTFELALESLSRDERFKATVYAMNTLLQKKGIYTSAEFEQLFCEHAQNGITRTAQASEPSASEAANREAAA